MYATPTAQGKSEALRGDKDDKSDAHKEEMQIIDETAAKSQQEDQENLLQRFSGVDNLLEEGMHYMETGLGNNLNEWLNSFKQYLVQAEPVAKWRGYKL